MTTKCYNTCFALAVENSEYILVDAGGGNGILNNLEKADIDVAAIHNAFITHSHSDHILGIIWIIRKIGMYMHAGKYEDNLNIYGHAEVIRDILTLARVVLTPGIIQLFGQRIILCPVEDAQKENLAGLDFIFFDIHSTKARQFGFNVQLKNGRMLTNIGDEPYHPLCRQYVQNCDWLLCEAFCLYKDRDIFKPYEKHHSTVKDACELAEKLGIKNLVLWHTEDQNLQRRQELYTSEGRRYYSGNLWVPDDLDVIVL
jgi:ribonuclease Z